MATISTTAFQHESEITPSPIVINDRVITSYDEIGPNSSTT
jgi:hypothetical protein